jgi:hypothetical protein
MLKSSICGSILIATFKKNTVEIGYLIFYIYAVIIDSYGRIAFQPAFCIFKDSVQVITCQSDDINQFKLIQPLTRDGLFTQHCTQNISGD